MSSCLIGSGVISCSNASISDLHCLNEAWARSWGVESSVQRISPWQCVTERPGQAVTCAASHGVSLNSLPQSGILISAFSLEMIILSFKLWESNDFLDILQRFIINITFVIVNCGKIDCVCYVKSTNSTWSDWVLASVQQVVRCNETLDEGSIVIKCRENNNYSCHPIKNDEFVN